MDIRGIPKERYNLQCSVCESKNGSCIQCIVSGSWWAGSLALTGTVGPLLHHRLPCYVCHQRAAAVGRCHPTQRGCGPASLLPAALATPAD